jgi:hypothetical protein
MRPTVPLGVALLSLLSSWTPLWSQAPVAAESEPNNTAATANVVALGDSVTGEIASLSDVDYFAVDIPAGTFVRIHPSSGVHMCLLDQDGVKPLSCNDPHMFWHLSFPFTRGGRYFIEVMRDQPGADYYVTGPYGMRLQNESFALNAGDPVRTRDTFPQDMADAKIATGLRGEVYLAGYNRVLAIDPDGTSKTVASDVQFNGHVAVDAFGEVVLTHTTTDHGSVWKVTGYGTLQFVADLGKASYGPPLAVGPDGDLWVANDTAIIRLDPLGNDKAHFPFLGAVFGLAVSSSGDVYVVSDYGPCPHGIYIMHGTTQRCTFPNAVADPRFAEIALDANGDVFVGQQGVELDDIPSDSVQRWGRVDIFASGATTSRQLAYVPHIKGMTFLRDAQGNMTSQLVATQSYSWIDPLRRVVEVGGAADRAAGAGFSVRFFHATLGRPADATLGAEYRATLQVTTDATDLTWTVQGGGLPPGLTLSAGGVLQGTPNDTGSFAFTVRATSGARSWFAPATIRVTPVDIPVAQVTDALLGGPTLTPALAAFLDLHGNRNGALDIGDLRAYLRAKGLLMTRFPLDFGLSH